MVGAVVGGWAFGRLPDGSETPDVITLILLGSCTWMLYILDRLLDLQIYPNNHTERHHFHYSNQFNLQLIVVALGVLNAILIFFLPKPVLYFGIFLSIGIAFYFWVLNCFFRATKKQWIKEPTTAICYALAVAGTALINKSSVSLSSWILALLFLSIAFQNLLVFSYFEFTENPENKNIVSKIGERAGRKAIFGITSFVVVVVFFFFVNGGSYVNYFAFTLLLMSLCLSFLIAVPQWALLNNRYRWLGDGVFLLPLFLVFWR